MNNPGEKDIKEEIDKMPEELVDSVYKYIKEKKKQKQQNREIRTYNLHGKFDDTDIRKKAYE